KRSQNTYDTGGHGGNRSRLRDDEPSPRVQKSGERTIGIADIHVFASGVWSHRSKFCISQGAKKRKKAADQPCQEHQAGRADRLHHLCGYKKDSAADDGPNDDGGGRTNTEIANQIGFRTVSWGRHQVGEYTGANGSMKLNAALAYTLRFGTLGKGQAHEIADNEGGSGSDRYPPGPGDRTA